MSKQFWKTTALTVATILTICLLVVVQSSVAMIPTTKPNPVVTPSQPLLAQITSVSQFKDVREGDYYFQALQSLTERYGCLSGRSDGTFGSVRPILRAELVGGVDCVVQRSNELLVAATADLAESEDRETMQKLRKLLSNLSAEVQSIQRR